MKHDHNFHPASEAGADPDRRLKARVLAGLIFWVLIFWMAVFWFLSAPLLDAMGVH